MTKRLLIDASHAEETRVVVLDGNRLEDFDVETATRKQIKGNIYLAKVIRVEPSLQAAFVEYGGNRHGFLAFGEIHPDYYQIPVADRQRLLAQQAEDEDREIRAAEAAEAAEAALAEALASEAPLDTPLEPSHGDEQTGDTDASNTQAMPLDVKPIAIIEAAPPEFTGGPLMLDVAEAQADEAEAMAAPSAETVPAGPAEWNDTEPAQTEAEYNEAAAPDAASDQMTDQPGDEPRTEEASEDFSGAPSADADTNLAEPGDGETSQEEGPPPESLGGEGDDAAEARERRQRQRFLRQYKIQEVIHRRQIMLIQVVKEERGNKGAALTTYLSLAGRYSVLMPNSPTGGGVSRKITSLPDRRRLKEAMAELDIPEGMGLIVRTAGANRPKPEIKRDCEYLLRLWDDIRDRTMQSVAPALIYEEASLIKRTIRDVYTRDIEDVLVDGEEGFKAARDFMRMLMPSHIRKVQFWSEGQPLFAKFQVEAQLDAMLNPVVQLRSGGYIVINQTEALVAIDVNSGRSTRERSIEDTALRTNLEAAEEAARQLRMRDLAGLIVIDFIDMESRKNNAAVERRLKDALKNDRARIQVGTISHFGLMEMSRQRLRPSISEAAMVICAHCGGMGHVRSPESAALYILRAIEDEGAKFRAAEIAVYLPPEIALYLFNHKRAGLAAIEARYAMRVLFSADPSMVGSNFRIEKLKVQTATLPVLPPASFGGGGTTQSALVDDEPEGETDADDGTEGAESAEPNRPGETQEEGERRRRRRRRRGKRRDGQGENAPISPASAETETTGDAETAETEIALPVDEPSEFDLVLAAELGDPEAIPVAEEAAEPPAKRRRARGPRRRRPETGDAPAGSGQADIADIFGAAAPVPAEPAPSPEPAGDAAAEIIAAESDIFLTVGLPVPVPMLPDADAAALEDAVAAEPAQPAEPGPVVRPILIGNDDAPAPEKKRGWWRR